MAYIKDSIIACFKKQLCELEHNPDKFSRVKAKFLKNYVIASLEASKTDDVVEVVRCKDCKRCYEKRTKLNNQLMRFCMRMDGNEYQVNANDFCSYGTPKERGGEK